MGEKRIIKPSLKGLVYRNKKPPLDEDEEGSLLKEVKKQRAATDKQSEMIKEQNQLMREMIEAQKNSAGKVIVVNGKSVENGEEEDNVFDEPDVFIPDVKIEGKASIQASKESSGLDLSKLESLKKAKKGVKE